MIEDTSPSRTFLAAAPGLLMRAAMRSPKDSFAGAIAFAAIGAIVANALFLQAGRHPSPMFGAPAFNSATAPIVANPLPRPRPTEAAAPSLDKALDSRLFDNRPAEIKPKTETRSEARTEPKSEPRAEARSTDPMASLIRNGNAPRQTQASNTTVLRPPASVPTSSRGDPLGELISCGNARCAR